MKQIFTITFILVLSLSSCNKDDDGFNFDYLKVGSVEATINGLQSDGATPINESFKYEYYDGLRPYVEDMDSIVYVNLRIWQHPNAEGGEMYMEFWYNIEKDTLVNLYNFKIDYERVQNQNELFKFNASSSSSWGVKGDNLSVTNFHINRKSGDLSYDFVVDLSDGNSSQNPATVSGKAKAKFYDIVN